MANSSYKICSSSSSKFSCSILLLVWAITKLLGRMTVGKEEEEEDDDNDVECTTDLLLRACFEATSVGDYILEGLFPLRHLHSQTLFVHSTEF